MGDTDKNFALGILTGQLSPFGRICIVLSLLGLGAVNFNSAVLNPPDTKDRIYKQEHNDDIAELKLELIERINTLDDKSAARHDEITKRFDRHLEHSAKYTEKIEHNETLIKELRSDLREHNRRQH